MAALEPAPFADIEVRFARSAAELAAVREIRRRVFGLEQGVPHAGSDDADDWRSLHALAVIPEGAIGTGRLTLPDSERPHAVIAWVATLADYRGHGVATAIMHALLDAADEAGAPTVLLSAQAHAIPFYRRLGFSPYGERFTAGGIPHQFMHRPRP